MRTLEEIEQSLKEYRAADRARNAAGNKEAREAAESIILEVLTRVYGTYRNIRAAGYPATEPTFTAAKLASLVSDYGVVRAHCPYSGGKFATRWYAMTTQKALARLVRQKKVMTSIGQGARGEARLYEPTYKEG